MNIIVEENSITLKLNASQFTKAYGAKNLCPILLCSN